MIFADHFGLILVLGTIARGLAYVFVIYMASKGEEE
jgi:hypothetical protein